MKNFYKTHNDKKITLIIEEKYNGCHNTKCIFKGNLGFAKELQLFSNKIVHSSEYLDNKIILKVCEF